MEKIQNSSTPRVTIILPTYNVEKYLEECLDSVVNQTYDNLEIICVNDGSTDSSREILEQYSCKDSRIIIIDQENKGIGGARNKGIEKATGKYITFWDTDDYFALEAIELMVKRLEETNADVCICDVQRFDDDTKEQIPANYIPRPFPEKEPFSWEEWADTIFLNSAVSCNKLVRLDLLKDNDIRYPEIHIYEDFEFMAFNLRLAKRIVLLNKKLAFYRRNRKGSLTYNPGKDMREAILSHTRTWDKLTERGLLDDQRLINSFMKKTAIDYRFYFRSLRKFDDFKKFFDMIFSEDCILRHYNPENGVIPEVEFFKVDNVETYLIDEYYRHYGLYEKHRQNSINRYQQIKGLKEDIKDINAANLRERNKLESQLGKIRLNYEVLSEERKVLKKEVLTLEKQLKKRENKLEEKNSELKDTKRQLAMLEKKYNRVINSLSYRVGRIVTWIPRKIKSIIKN